MFDIVFLTAYFLTLHCPCRPWAMLPRCWRLSRCLCFLPYGWEGLPNWVLVGSRFLAVDVSCRPYPAWVGWIGRCVVLVAHPLWLTLLLRRRHPLWCTGTPRRVLWRLHPLWCTGTPRRSLLLPHPLRWLTLLEYLRQLLQCFVVLDFFCCLLGRDHLQLG